MAKNISIFTQVVEFSEKPEPSQLMMKIFMTIIVMILIIVMIIKFDLNDDGGVDADMTQGKIDLRNESGRPMKVKVVGEVSEK